ncbi:Protein of unknown function (DUF1620) [Fragilaria crotonensis]|nr:Protein of unknown function (DUF1620) [Fragilaria crotonensis]
MKFFLTAFLLLLSSATALYEEETGLNDFTISTTGHGVPTNVFATETSLITSDNACTVASRSLDTGDLNWRRYVCAESRNSNASHVMQTAGAHFFTADNLLVRAWTLENGALVWETKPTEGIVLLGTTVAGPKTILATTSADGSSLQLYNAANGRSLGSAHVKDVDSAAAGATWLSIVSGEDGSVSALVGTVTANGETKGDLLVTVLSFDISSEGEEIIATGTTRKLTHFKESFVASSLQIQERKNQYFGLGVTAKGKVAHFSISSSDISQVTELHHPLWTAVESLEALDGGVIRVVGRDDGSAPSKTSKALFLYNGNSWGQLGEDSSLYDGVASCAAANLVLASNMGRLQVYDSSAVPLKPSSVQLEGFPDVVSLETLSCATGSMSVLVSTSKLSSTVVKITDGSAKIVWTKEDGISTVTSALLLDASVALLQDEEAMLSKLGFVARLESQVQSGINLFAHLAASETRDDDFGFVKVALLMSQKLHRIWAVPTVGKTRGTVTWKLDLPSDASWHTMVHGTASSAALVHGINGGTHSPDVLVLSSTPGETTWSCLDAVTGVIHATGSAASSAPVAQVIPIFGGGSCRQVAVLIHKDHSLSVVPDDDKSKAAVAREIQKSQNGFYGHLINRDTNSIETFTLLESDNAFHIQRVGLTGFKGEKIVKVAYPLRDEVVQSPCSVLGDDSILLKYLNPHMAVIVTMVDEEEDIGATKDPLTAALEVKKAATVRKPKGVSQPDSVAAEAAPSDDVPNLFINVVDTVSGRVLHRISHANAALDSAIPVLVNENWIIYAFFNDKSRRTELGVLTLYEGMIDKAGITAFTSPEQVLSFSSLEPRESRPVILSKTYAIVKPVTALGVTATRAGISTRQILIASADDKITAISRQLLEPRRPTGQVKPHEKTEGLFQYSPLLPLVSLSSPTYNQTVHAVSAIVSSSTALESQSLILAFGGPDVFFARISPSNGFDLLPESFSRMLLSTVVIALLVVFFVVKNMGEKKAIQNSWA